ncbi:MAG: hypothetical protein AB6733_06055 [Clostridiaceae bacterium]
MQLSSKVIKEINVDEKGSKTIITKDIPLKKSETIQNSNVSSNYSNTSEEENRYRNIANMILDEARRKSEAILLRANIDAKTIEDEAYNKGYNLGYEQGNSRGYSEGLEKGNIEAQQIKESIQGEAQSKANNLVFHAKEEYENYLNSKKEEIKLLMLQISDSLFKDKVIDLDIIEKTIANVIETSKNTESFVIKANKNIVENLKDKIEGYKSVLTFKAEIHLIQDETLENNKIVIEKNNGKTIVDFNDAYDNIIEIIKNFK